MDNRVLNRAPAEVQISAEQLLREARERQIEDEVSMAKKMASLRNQQINDPEELKMHQATERQNFERRLGGTSKSLNKYLNYARWEESQLEYRRARSIYERAIEDDYKEPRIWLAYIEFELRNKFINHARNVADRAVTLLPRVSQLWYKAVHLEQMMGNVEGTRILFERWMQWEPEEQAWFAYINFLERVADIKQARDVYERFCACYPTSSSYIKYAKWEERHSQLVYARNVFERAVEEVPELERTEELFIAFAAFETRCKEYHRARVIYQQALEYLPEKDSHKLYLAFVAFEKRHGDRKGMEGVIISKRRQEYEEHLDDNPKDYDVWFDYIRLMEADAEAEAESLFLSAEIANEQGAETAVLDESGQKLLEMARERVRDVYERAIAEIPSVQEKKYWKRYIYLFISYALFEELQVEDMEKARQVYQTCLKVIPHETFTFAKIWINAAELEIRATKNVDVARKLLGQAIELCPKDKLFKAYIQLELQLGKVDRARKLYEKFLEFSPHNCYAWTKFAQLERKVGEETRARAIYELAVSQHQLDMPEVLWKNYIDMEIELKKYDNVIILYERLLERTKHVKAWISYAKFLVLTKKDPEAGRDVFDRAYKELKALPSESKEERFTLLEAWKMIENDLLRKNLKGANLEKLRKVESMMPQRIKRKRELESGGWEEYYDYIYPDEATEKPVQGLKILQLAQAWKKNKKAKIANP